MNAGLSRSSKSKLIRALVCSVAFATLATGCSKSSPSPENLGRTEQPAVVESIDHLVVDDARPSANKDVPRTSAIQVRVTVNKEALLSQEFLYGADLQYSSFYDSDMDLYNQSLAIGHVPARFRIVGRELQLVADNQRLYPSEVNHPEQLIARFRILSQTDKNIVISAANSGIFLSEAFEATHADAHGGLTIPAAKPPRDLWVRSFEFAPQGNYLLQQTSVMMADGTIAEFMESIFPRETLAPGEQFEKFEMDPENPAGGDEGVFERFRLLAGERIFKGEKKLALAQHFDISKTPANAEGTIDWYATPNIPDEALEPVKQAVEGWNRYYRRFKGIERDVVRFKGRLPEGVHLGDPRYNVINWDNRLIAGAAYETQATDPATGKQSHSLIYMPAAWLKIGFDYWKGGQFAETSGTKTESVAPGALQGHGAVATARLACLRDIRSAAETAISGRLSKDEVQEFGVRLLKGTLFHEVGHALGLAHNFKGSLSFDRSKPGSMFSTSIMDYNDYEIERGAFPDLHSADGPQLEYDRQILSAIYNRGADVAEDAPVVPMCNDEEADAEEDGVDPLCIRYDIEKDPTLSIGTALDRIQLAEKTGDVTLAQALVRVPGLVLTDEALAKVKSQDELKQAASLVASSLKGSIKFYLVGGKASLARVARTNVKALLQFADDVLLEGYDERGMRERAFASVQKALELRSLPQPVSAALAEAEKATMDTLARTPFMQGISEEDRAKLVASLTASVHKSVMAMEKDEANGLPKVRSYVLGGLARHKKVPYFFGKAAGAELAMDFETSLVGLLGDAVTASGDATTPARTKSERLTAALALASYRGRPQGDAALAAVEAALLKARASATDNASRETIESLIQALKPDPSDKDE